MTSFSNGQPFLGDELNLKLKTHSGDGLSRKRILERAMDDFSISEGPYDN